MYNYQVVIGGMESIPLRTNKAGLRGIILAFGGKKNTANAVVNNIVRGVGVFKNEFVTVSKIKKQKMKKNKTK